MEIQGLVHLISETQVVGSAGTFKKRTIVILQMNNIFSIYLLILFKTKQIY